MSEMSTANLYAPLETGGAYLRSLTPLMWPTYRRTTLDQGGDHEARFTIDEETHNVTRQDLEYMFYEWVGHHFVESFAGTTRFMGYVHTLRLQLGGLTLIHTLENMANQVYVRYTTDSAASEAVTSAAADTDSDAKYGGRTIYLQPSAYMTSTYADALRDDYLETHAWPRVYPVDVFSQDLDSGALLEIEMRGYTDTVSWRWHQAASGADVAVDTQLETLFSFGDLDFVSEGSIVAPTTTIDPGTDYVTKLQRIADLLEGRAYSWGCFQGRSFDVAAWDTSTIKYRRRAFGPRAGLYSGGQLVPAPMVTPSGIVYTEDIFAGRPQASTLLEDPRAAFISGVEYSIDGVSLVALGDIDAIDAVAALAMDREYAMDRSEKLAVEGQRTVGWIPQTKPNF